MSEEDIIKEFRENFEGELWIDYGDISENREISKDAVKLEYFIRQSFVEGLKAGEAKCEVSHTDECPEIH